MSSKVTRRGKCRVCGCTDDRACVVNGVPCSWANAAKTLCSACVTEKPAIRVVSSARKIFIEIHRTSDGQVHQTCIVDGDAIAKQFAQGLVEAMVASMKPKQGGSTR